jgi:hypothetical protein
MNKWLGSRYVPYGSDVCERCGNEQLARLHTVQILDDGVTTKQGEPIKGGSIIEVGSHCVALLCAGQDEEVHVAEMRMDKEERRFKKIEELRNSWTIFTYSDKKVKVTGHVGKTTIEIFFVKHAGYTTRWKDAPYFKGHKQAMTWCEEHV